MSKLLAAVVLVCVVTLLGFIFTSPQRDCAPQWLTALDPRFPDPPLKCWMDGCSAVPDFDFTDCCNQHDVAYWIGGSHADRLLADNTLKQCLETRGHPWLARLYFLGVRVGGVPWLPAKWRWGYGWPFTEGNRGYR